MRSHKKTNQAYTTQAKILQALTGMVNYVISFDTNTILKICIQHYKYSNIQTYWNL